MNKLRGLALLLLLSSAWTSAKAAKIEVIPSKDFTLVTISGELQHGDDDTFKQKVFLLKEAAVMFNSEGGSLMAGLEIGRAIRLKGFDTVVPDSMFCASACALAWLGGKTRWAGPEARIAFHAAWMLRNGRKEETGPGNALVGAYLNSLGLADDAVFFITKAAPDDAELLTFEKAEALGISVKRFELKSDTREANIRPELTKPSAPADPDAAYYDPSISTLNPQRPAPPPAPETKTAALPPIPAPSMNPKWRPDDPDMQPQVLDLAHLEAAAQVQRRLQERGYFRGIVDGIWGQRSRVALRDFKIQNRLPQDDRWDLRTQLAVFDDRYQFAPVTYVPTNPEQDSAGLYTPFPPSQGASLHPLNPGDALKIQERLFQLNYYRKQGDGIWGMASRSALTDFKVVHGLPADDVWDSRVEESIEGDQVVPATVTPFGEWVQPGTACNNPNNPKRLVVASKNIPACASNGGVWWRTGLRGGFTPARRLEVMRYPTARRALPPSSHATGKNCRLPVRDSSDE